MPGFRNLVAWQKAHELALRVYQVTEDFPAAEQCALRDQLRRAAANIAEGKSRQGDRAFAHFLDVALGSLAEVQALMLLARDLGYTDGGEVDDLLGRSEALRKMLSSLLARCERGKRARR